MIAAATLAFAVWQLKASAVAIRPVGMLFWTHMCLHAESHVLLFQEGVGAPSDTLDSDHGLSTHNPTVVSVFPGKLDPGTTSISGKGFDECTAGTQVRKRRSKCECVFLLQPVTKWLVHPYETLS